MNASQFMDKQIMDLSRSFSYSSSAQNKDFIDLANHQPPPPSKRDEEEDEEGDGVRVKKEEIVPSYDFQPIRPVGAAASQLDGSSRTWNSSDSKASTAATIRHYGSLDSIEPKKAFLGKEQSAYDATLVSEIDRMMKKYTDDLLHALDGVNARLTQLETRTHHLENCVDDVKVSVGNNYGSTDGKMRQMENILREVQMGVQALKEKQEVMEGQLKFAKLQLSEQQSESHHVDSVQQAATAPLQSHQQPSPANLPPSLPTLVPPNVSLPPPAAQQSLAPAVQLPNQFSQSQIPSVPQREPYFQSPAQTQEPSNQQYQVPPTQPTHALPTGPPPQQFQAPPQQQFSQPPPVPQPPQPHSSLAPVNASQPQPSFGHHPEDTAYIPPQNYPPNIRQPPSQQLSGPLPSQQYYGASSQIYETPSSRSSSGFSTGYGPPSGPNEPYAYVGPPQYGSNSAIKPQLSSLGTAQGGGSGYAQLPTARVLPHALPTASGASSGSSGSGTSVPMEDVVDKVTSMGFPRDRVRAAVRRLTENGQSVCLNDVLDKLMNEGDGQPQRGWFGR